MNKAISFNKNLLLLGIPALMILALILLTSSHVFQNNPKALSLPITLDLLLTIPLVYFLIIRKTQIPKYSTFLVIMGGMIIGTYILSEENQYYISLFKSWGLPVIEIAVVTFIIYKFRKTIKVYREHNELSPDFYSTLKTISYQVLPRVIVVPLVSEISLLYYGFINWKKRILKPNEFTYHKENGSIALYGTLIFLMTVESYAMHVHIIKNGDPVTAWVLTALTTYNSIQVFGFIKSIIKRPISIEKDTLVLHYGIMNETIIELKNIESIELRSIEIADEKDTRGLSPLGSLESNNLLIRLKKESTMNGLFGIKRKFKNLAFHVDRKEDFKNQIEIALCKSAQ